MKKKKLIGWLLGVAILVLLAGGGAAWWFMKGRGSAAPAAPVEDKREYKYLSLDKVIVMLRAQEGGPLSSYIAVDLVFKTPLESEAAAKNQLPLLRSIAVKALSSYTLDQANKLTIEQLVAALNQAFDKGYAEQSRKKPFTEVMIGKLIIE